MLGYFLVTFLAQIPREDTFGDIFGGLLGQIPIALILQVCLAAALLVAGLVYFTGVRRRKARAQQLADQGAPGGYPEPDYGSTGGADPGDLPDLDLLVGQASLGETPPSREARLGVYTVRLHDGQTAEAREVVSILRDAGDGRLIVQMGGTAYRTLVGAPDAKKQFTQIMKELAEVIARPDERAARAPQREPAPPPESESAPQSALQPAPPAAEMPDLRDLIEEPAPVEPAAPPARSTPPPPIDPDGAMPGDLPSYKLDDHPVRQKRGRLGGPKFEAAPIPELNIAAAIEAYLQHKLKHTPEYAGRNIHVHAAPGGGVRIQVDNKYFDAVGDVDELDVRAFLSATIQEWQERQ